MSRGVIAVDRFVAFLVGILVIAAGAFALAWWLDLFSWLPRSLNTSAVTDTTSQAWWPWVAGLLGAVLVLAGLRWLAGHLPNSRVGELTLPGSGTEGKLRAAATPVAKAAADVLEPCADLLTVKIDGRAADGDDVEGEWRCGPAIHRDGSLLTQWRYRARKHTLTGSPRAQRRNTSFVPSSRWNVHSTPPSRALATATVSAMHSAIEAESDRKPA